MKNIIHIDVVNLEGFIDVDTIAHILIEKDEIKIHTLKGTYGIEVTDKQVIRTIVEFWRNPQYNYLCIYQGADGVFKTQYSIDFENEKVSNN